MLIPFRDKSRIESICFGSETRKLGISGPDSIYFQNLCSNKYYQIRLKLNVGGNLATLNFADTIYRAKLMQVVLVFTPVLAGLT